MRITCDRQHPKHRALGNRFCRYGRHKLQVSVDDARGAIFFDLGLDQLQPMIADETLQTTWQR